MTDFPDPFRAKRQQDGVLVCPFQPGDEKIPMILGYRDVRKAAKDWPTYSSDAPFRLPIPSEEKWRTIRQLPFETDPPDHTDYRQIIEPFFRRPTQPEVIERITQLVQAQVQEALSRDSIEVVRGFSLPLQSRALTILFNVPASEAELWISWGTSVFLDGDGVEKGAALERYINGQLNRAEAQPGDDFFSVLAHAPFRGRKLTRTEMLGFANLTFSGGRETIIHTVSTVIAYLADTPEALDFLRADPGRLVTATEEFVRIVSPLTHMGRVCKKGADVLGVPVEPDGRASLCWASANRDDTVFEEPDRLKLDRSPNPHVGFGSGIHACMGAPHARLILRTLLQTLCEQVGRVEVLEAQPHLEKEAEYQRAVGYTRLVTRFHPRAT